MKKLLSLLIIGLCALCVQAQQTVVLKGQIGKYKIEVELEGEKGISELKGKYRYQGKTTYLDLKGDMSLGEIVYLEESYDGKVTGNFYLEGVGPHTLEGHWIGNGKVHEVVLKVQSGSLGDLGPYALSHYNASVNEAITGSYAAEYYFINEMFFSEENPNLDIGFNGGVIAVEEVGADSIVVEFDLLCGPTYHIASFAGRAHKVSEGKYVFKSLEYDEDEPCHLVFEFKEKTLEITQPGSSFACGFGARAHAAGSYQKVSDAVDREAAPSLDELLGRQ